MKSIFDKLQTLSEARHLTVEEVAHVSMMNTLYRNRLITYNELCLGLGGQRIGVAGDRFADEDRQPDRPQLI